MRLRPAYNASMPPPLGSALRFSPVVLAACIVLVLVALTQFGRLPKQMSPLSERSQFLVYMNMPDGTDISQTETPGTRDRAVAW